MMHNERPNVLVTMPVDCRFALPAALLASKKLKNDTPPKEIRVLVFSPKEIISVFAKIYERVYFSGSKSLDRSMDFPYEEFEQILLHPASTYEKAGLNYPFYTAEWDSKRYLELSAAATSTSLSSSSSYWIEISVEVRNGVVHRHPLQPFFVKGESCFVSQTWLEHVLIYTDWERLWPFSLVVIYCITFARTYSCSPESPLHFTNPTALIFSFTYGHYPENPAFLGMQAHELPNQIPGFGSESSSVFASPSPHASGMVSYFLYRRTASLPSELCGFPNLCSWFGICNAPGFGAVAWVPLEA